MLLNRSKDRFLVLSRSSRSLLIFYATPFRYPVSARLVYRANAQSGRECEQTMHSLVEIHSI